MGVRRRFQEVRYPLGLLARQTGSALVFTAHRRFNQKEKAVPPSRQVWTWGACERRGGTGLGPAWVRSRRRCPSPRPAFLTTAARRKPGPRRSLSSRVSSWLRCEGKRADRYSTKLWGARFISWRSSITVTAEVIGIAWGGSACPAVNALQQSGSGGCRVWRKQFVLSMISNKHSEKWNSWLYFQTNIERRLTLSSFLADLINPYKRILWGFFALCLFVFEFLPSNSAANVREGGAPPSRHWTNQALVTHVMRIPCNQRSAAQTAHNKVLTSSQTQPTHRQNRPARRQVTWQHAETIKVSGEMFLQNILTWSWKQIRAKQPNVICEDWWFHCQIS